MAIVSAQQLGQTPDNFFSIFSTLISSIVLSYLKQGTIQKIQPEK
jgi:hypothetical protein